jgi:hypothetical protein
MAKQKDNWIADATKNKGGFKKKATAHDMSVAEYAAEVTKEGSKATTKTKRQANLAKTLQKMHPKKK